MKASLWRPWAPRPVRGASVSVRRMRGFSRAKGSKCLMSEVKERPGISTPAYAGHSATAPLAPFTIERREPGPNEVLMDILYCGVCHSDIHNVRNEWGGANYPMVPGHE